jgi:hypothetical protein
VEHEDGIFWELASGIDAAEARTRAADELAADRPSFADLLRRLPAGEVVTMVTIDGADIRGRVLEVGSDVVRLGEVSAGAGAKARRVVRCHDIRLAAVARLVWEPTS